MSDQKDAVALPERSTEILSTNLDTQTRTIFLGEIDEGVGDHFVKCMHILTADDDMPVHIIMNSMGGFWADACAIYDCIKSCGTQVSVEVIGACMSAAVIIVQACDSRFIHPNALVMIHDGTQEVGGDVKNLEAWGKQSKNERDRMYSMLSSKSNHKSAYWRRKCAKGDFILSAEKAVSMGLFDGVIENV